MLEAFWAHHKMKHPTIVVPKENKMHDNFRVRSVRQVAVIDQQGIIQLITVGAQPDTIQRIDAKLKKLLK